MKPPSSIGVILRDEANNLLVCPTLLPLLCDALDDGGYWADVMVGSNTVCGDCKKKEKRYTYGLEDTNYWLNL